MKFFSPFDNNFSFFYRLLQVHFIQNWCACATTIVTTTPTRRSPSSALVATRTAGTTTSCRLHLLANRAVIWQAISGSLHKTTCSMPCSPNQTPPRERSRASPTKTAHSVYIHSRVYVGSSCKTFKDASQVHNIWYQIYRFLFYIPTYLCRYII